MKNNQDVEMLTKRVIELEDKEIIRDLLSNYAMQVDLCRYDAFMNLWTDDSVFITDGPGTTIEKRGKEEIKSYLVGLLPKSDAGTQHLQLDYQIQVDGKTARAVGYQLITSSKTAVPSIARCALRTFTFKKKRGKWLIQEAISRSMTNAKECQKLVK